MFIIIAVLSVVVAVMFDAVVMTTTWLRLSPVSEEVVSAVIHATVMTIAWMYAKRIGKRNSWWRAYWFAIGALGLCLAAINVAWLLGFIK